ncbi:hypothetical protein SY2F82_77160 [Streptomyces sp. Y2F8-2]|nr:hypothetical protein SY2F82_77160 [Streptomyces sp. Y2F8-2]
MGIRVCLASRAGERQLLGLVKLELLGLRQVDAPSTIATATCTSTPARSRQPATALDGSTFASASVSPVRSAQRRSSTAPA